MSALKPPKAIKRPLVTRHHGIRLSDEYAWLRAENWEETLNEPSLLPADIRKQIEEENSYAEAMLADTAELRRLLLAEMKSRIKPDDSSVPMVDGPWAYYWCFVAGMEHARLCRKPTGGGIESILFDPNVEFQAQTLFGLASIVHSPDHTLLAYAVDPNGSEFYTVHIRDLASGVDCADVIHNTSGEIVWGNDSRTLFYIRVDQSQRPSLVYSHRIGSSASEDALVYQESDPAFDVNIDKTRSGAFILIEANSHRTNEVWLVDADRPAAPLLPVVARQLGHEYHVEHRGERLIITTNSEGAGDFRICEAMIADLDIASWHEIVPHKRGCAIVETVAYARHLVRLELDNGLPRVVVRRFRDGAEHGIVFSEEAYNLSLEHGFEFDTDSLRFTYSSLTTPQRVFDYDMETRVRCLRKACEIPTGHDPSHYVTRRLFVPAHDSESIPVTLLYHRKVPLNGSATLILYGYGSYGDTVPAEFSPELLSLIDRGFVYAIAHVRGGGEKGNRWREQGMHEYKRNAFTDFIAVGEHLIMQRYTRRGRIIAMGHSAGGALVGAATNMAPDLFLAAVIDAPFVDVLNSLLDEDLPLTPGEWVEWGNPIENRKDFDLICSYCPYQNVDRKPYPHILAQGAIADLRVPYWEPMKWVARLRECKTDDHLLLLKIGMEGGHDAASGRFERLKDTVLTYVFVLKVAGLDG
jgi:oligopeptidase B